MIKIIKNYLLNNNKLHKKSMIANGATIKNSVLEAYSNVARNADIVNSHVGKRSSIGRYTKIRFADIGSYCAISWDSTIGADQHPTNRISGSAAFFQKRFGLIESNISKGEVLRTTIGNDVLIGCNSVIKSGVSVGTGAIIGSGAVVLKDVEPYEIVGGVPAKHIAWRFDERVRTNLLKSEWWNWDDQIIKDNMRLFQNDNVEEIITLIGDINA